MSKTAYCYTCNARHPMEEMRQVMTGKGIRWRCINTIKAARLALAKRQEFGVQTTSNNRSDAKAKGIGMAATRRDPVS